MPLTAIRNCNIYDGVSSGLLADHDVLIENERIKEVSESAIKVSNAVEIDARGRTLMPRLSDAQVHLLAPSLTAALENMPYTLRMAHAVSFLKRMLDRGFTTVRDAAGTDGVHDVRKAVRDGLRAGARHITVMQSGGLASVNSGMSDYTQFSREELLVIVEEAKAKNTYVLAQAYTPSAIEHAVTAGVRSVEHAIFIDKERANLVAANGAFVVPTLACYRAKQNTGALPEWIAPRLQSLLDAMAPCIETCDQAGAKLGCGT